jgi:5-deoxy-glucuronate isomerase
MKICLAGNMFDDVSVWEHLQAATDNRYDAVELRSTHISHNMDMEQIRDVRSEILRRNLKVGALSCFCGNYGMLEEDECQNAFDIFTKYVNLAELFDTPYVRVWPAWIDSAKASQEIWSRTVRWMRRSGEYAACHGKSIIMEMHHGTLCDCAESALYLLDAIGLKNVGLTWDPVNLYQVPTDYGRQAIRAIGKHIFNVHIKDIVALTSDSEPGCFSYGYYARHIGRFTKVAQPEEDSRYFAHRRIHQGGIDWMDVFKGLDEIGYKGYITVESVCEKNPSMPNRGALAKACMQDIRAITKQAPGRADWCVASVEAPGMFRVIGPDVSDCSVVHVYRLNLSAGTTHILNSKDQEMNAVLIHGSAHMSGAGMMEKMSALDSFYIPGNASVQIKAESNSVFYIAAAVCEGYGKPFFRKYDSALPIGEIHQIHGKGSGAREVFFTLNPEMPASRLICGITSSNDGGWTSWPPHQHEKDLEEVYCYYGMPEPEFGLHISYTESGRVEDMQAHVVRDGIMVLIPKGYHPTVSTPGTKNRYFWVLASFSHASRRYDRAVTDSVYEYQKN